MNIYPQELFSLQQHITNPDVSLQFDCFMSGMPFIALYIGVQHARNNGDARLSCHSARQLPPVDKIRKSCAMKTGVGSKPESVPAMINAPAERGVYVLPISTC